MTERAPAFTPVAAHLPAVYQEDAGSFAEVAAYLGLLDELLREALTELDDAALWLSPGFRALHPPGLPDDAPAEAVLARQRAAADELAAWFGLTFPASWQRPDEPEDELARKQRALLRAARMWRRRGTPRGFYARLVFAFELAGAQRPVMIEHFRYREDDAGGDAYAHRVSLLMPITARFDDVRARREVAAWVEREAPAHLLVRVCWLAPDDARLTGYDAADAAAVRALLRTIASYTPLEDGIHLTLPAAGRAQDALGHGTLPGPARHTGPEDH